MPRQYLIIILAVAAISIIALVVLLPKSQPTATQPSVKAEQPIVDPDAGNYTPTPEGKNDFRKPGTR